MKISTEIGSLAKHVGEGKAIELFAKAGFDAYDLSMFRMAPYDHKERRIAQGDHPLQVGNWRGFVKELRHIADECGIVCNQSHAPFPSRGEEIMPYLFRAIECTAIAGGGICVIHPDNHKSAEENAEMYLRLLPFAKECGVKIATENMWNWDRERDEALPAACSHHEDFLRHIEAVNDPDFVACLDIGHAEMRGLNTSVGLMTRTLGRHIAALHVHDNDAHRDSHQIPFSMDLGWTSIVKYLVEIDYRGDMTLECDRYLSDYTAENVAEGVAEMQRAADRLREMFLNFKALRSKKA